LIEHCADPIFVIDADGIVAQANPATDALVGPTAGRSAVAVLSEKAHPEDLDATLRTLSEVSGKAGLHSPVVLRVLTEAGTWVHLSAVANNRLADPNVRGIVINAHDISAEAEQLTRIERSEEALITALSRASEVRDPYTSGHQRNVAKWSVRIGRQLRLPYSALRELRLGASVHDLGKIAVPVEVLARPGPLSVPERMMVETHCRIGYEILRDTDISSSVLDIVLHHHERLDGSGYPDRLAGDQLEVPTRIVAVADVLDAMSSHRPYRPAVGLRAALDELATNAGRLYCPEVVAAAVESACSIEGVPSPLTRQEP
jgi:PAS domain S-box-containing protein